jgi:DNA repair protein RecO (recombination protein O)
VEPLYEHYQQALYQLLAAKNRSDQAWSLRQFEYHLLNELGQGLVCDKDMHQQAIEAEVLYHFYPENGAIRAEMDGIGKGIPIQGNCLLALAESTFCESCLGQWKQLFRAILNQYLGGKPILTRQLFR